MRWLTCEQFLRKDQQLLSWGLSSRGALPGRPSQSGAADGPSSVQVVGLQEHTLIRPLRYVTGLLIWHWFLIIFLRYCITILLSSPSTASLFSGSQTIFSIVWESPQGCARGQGGGARCAVAYSNLTLTQPRPGHRNRKWSQIMATWASF